MQLSFSAPRPLVKLLKNTKGSVSLSRHILNMVMGGVCKNFPSTKRRK